MRTANVMQLKGDILISSLVGVAPCTTMDLGTKFCGFDLTRASGSRAFYQLRPVVKPLGFCVGAFVNSDAL